MAKKQSKKDRDGPGRPSDEQRPEPPPLPPDGALIYGPTGDSPAARALVLAVEALVEIPSCNTAYKCHAVALSAVREMKKVLPFP